MGTLTVAELRKLLEKYNDDAPVYLCTEPSGYYEPCARVFESTKYSMSCIVIGLY